MIQTPRAGARVRVSAVSGQCQGMSWSPPAPAPISSKMDTTKILYELERVWEVGTLPGQQTAEQNEAWRQLWRILQEPTAARAPPHLRLVC
jgi:hypothetical protein